MSDEFVFKLATDEQEFEEIHALNHRTFAEEIPQHPLNADGRLVDRFHDENTYVICVQQQRVVAMVALRRNRPFSLDQKLSNLDEYLPAGRSVVEIRLLAIEPQFRRRGLLTGLIDRAFELAISWGADLAIISATTRQLGLYERLGFVAFGPQVGHDEALFQPMYLTRENVRAIHLRPWRNPARSA